MKKVKKVKTIKKIKRIIVLIGILAVGFVIVSTNTMWLHPRPRKDLLTKRYTSYPDLFVWKEGNRNLVLALHGMYANPLIFEELGRRLTNQGWDLFAPALPNAALNSEDLRRQEVYQWKESLSVVQAKLEQITNGYEKVIVLGHSMGGSLALMIAAQNPQLDGVAVVSAPLFLEYKNDWTRNLLIKSSGLLYFFIPDHGTFLGKEPPLDRISELEDPRGGGTYMYALTVHSLRLALKNELIPALPSINMPLFAAYEQKDQTVSFDNLGFLTNRINSVTKDVLITDSSADKTGISTQHKLFSYIYVKDTLHQRIEHFLSRHAFNNADDDGQ